MEQIPCLIASSFIWVGKSPLTIIQKSMFSFASLTTAYSIGNVDRDTGSSMGLALAGIYFLTTKRPHFGWIGYGIQGGFSGYETIDRWFNGIKDEDDLD